MLLFYSRESFENGARRPGCRGKSGCCKISPVGRSASTKPPALQEDVVLRALRFLETLLQRDDAQKVAFLKDLATLWPQCDSRVLR